MATSYLWALFVCLKIGGEAGILSLKMQETKEKIERREAGGGRIQDTGKGNSRPRGIY